jgi:hypothetical protein
MRNVPSDLHHQPKETRMTFARTVLAAAAMALACGVASAQDRQTDATTGKSAKQPRNFNEMDRNDDGKLSRAEAASKPQLLAKWKELDKDNDGSLSRTEYLREMARQDGAKVQERISRAFGTDKSDSAATGGTAPQSQRK